MKYYYFTSKYTNRINQQNNKILLEIEELVKINQNNIESEGDTKNKVCIIIKVDWKKRVIVRFQNYHNTV